MKCCPHLPSEHGEEGCLHGWEGAKGGCICPMPGMADRLTPQSVNPRPIDVNRADNQDMTDDSHSVDLAARAADAVRDLARTAASGRYRQPAEVYGVVGQLELLIHRMPTVLDDVEKWLQAELEAGHLGDDRNGINVSSAVEVASRALTDARVELIRLEVRLSDAHRALSHLTGKEG